jgi:Tol biopolymer transport system component
MRRTHAFLFALTLLVLSGLSLPAHAATQTAPAAAARCFAEVTYCINDPFSGYWQQNGGLAVFGLPVTAARDEVNRDTGMVYQTQWLERNRFELHPENRAPYTVLLGRLGDDALRKAGRDWASLPKASPSAAHYFAQTGHAISHDPFWRYWSTHGLELGDRGVSQRESLALFGFPLTEPAMETNSSGDTVLTQWYERARFEYHPNKPEPYKVLLGLLGNEVLGSSGRQPLTGRIAFVRNGDIYVMNADDSQQRRLTTHGTAAAPSWSPDGQRLAFWGPGGVNILAVAGDQPARVIFNGSSLAQDAPRWSPDGQRVVVDSFDDIHVVNVDGSGALNVTNSPNAREWVARWSPTGRRIVFQSDGDCKICLVNADGSGLTVLSRRGSDASPNWSPDGERIAFISIRNGYDYDIYLINADGTGEVDLTDVRGEEVNPSWSPDGERIAYMAHENGNISIRTIDVHGSRRVAVAGIASEDTQQQLSWSPDGQRLVFTRGGGVYVVGADGGPQIRLVADASAFATWAPN